MYFSTKQLKIMKLIREGNGRDLLGRFIPIDLDQLCERLDYQPSKQSLQFSLRALVKHGMIEKAGRETRRHASRVLYRLTEDGMKAMAPEPVGAFVGADEDDDELPE